MEHEMKTKVLIKEYMMQEVGEIVFDVLDKENNIFLAHSFYTYEEAKEWIKTQKDLTL